MARTSAPAKEAGALVPTRVIRTHRLPGITFRPGVVYQASTAVRAALEAAGVLEVASTGAAPTSED